MLRKNYFLKRKNIWHIILNLFSKSAKWDNKDLIIHSFYDSFKKKSLKDFNFNLIKKYLYKKLSIKSNVCKSVEFVNITKKNLFFNVCAIYLDLDSFSNIDTLIDFLKYKNIQICYVNNKNIVINHNFKFYSLRNYNSTNFPIINSLIASCFINNCKIKIAYSSYKIKYYLSKIFNYKKLFDYFLLKSRHLFWKTLISLRLFTKAKNFRFKYLSLEEFLSLKFNDIICKNLFLDYKH